MWEVRQRASTFTHSAHPRRQEKVTVTSAHQEEGSGPGKTMESRGQTFLILMGHTEDPPPTCALLG